MKDLFVCFYPITPHLETDLELIAQSMKKGRDIRVVMCNKALKMCLYNFDHKISRCVICQSKINKGLKYV